MVRLAIDTNIPDVQDRLTKMARDQVPFANALALTWTANDSRDAVKQGLPNRFVIRRPWVERGIRSQPASKRRPQARVFSRDVFMVKQEEGGTRRARKKYLAIPRAIRKSKRQPITRARKPGRVLEKPNVFVAPLKGNRKGIFRKVGRKGAQRRLLYVLEPRPVQIEPAFEFRDTVEKTVKRRYRKNFGRALARAIKTAR